MQQRFLSAHLITTALFVALPMALVADSAIAAELTAFSTANTATPPAPWHVVGLPSRYNKPITQFDVTDLDNKKVLRVRTDKSYGNLVHAWQGNASTISFNWRLDTPLREANLKLKSTDDTALKVCVSFDLPLEKVPYADRAKLKIAQLLSHERLPTATICYVWAHIEPVGADLDNPFTGRVHYIVLNSGESQLKTWQSHQRNIGADFLKAYGTETTLVPPVTAISVGADSDNTQASSLGYVSDITLKP